MNVWTGTGRLTADPTIRYSQSGNAVGNYSLAVRKRYVRDGEADSVFIRCTVFNKSAEFAEKYLRKGMMIAVSGELITGSYKNREGVTIPTAEIYVDRQDFCESKSGSTQNAPQSAQEASQPKPDKDGFMNIPDGIDEELPFT